MRIGKQSGLFRPDRPDAEPWTIVMPPPNVTGSLHIGHALDNTLQDILIRHARMQGKDALWVVGTDHAGIATQMVVERQLEERQDKRTELQPRRIHRQGVGVEGGERRRRSPASCAASALVRLGQRALHDGRGLHAAPSLKVFVELYRAGLLYRDKRLVNWDPKFQTAISDLEVETREVQGKFWHLRYPLADGSGVDRGRDDAARNDARRHGGRGASRRRALRGDRRQAGAAADHRRG